MSTLSLFVVGLTMAAAIARCTEYAPYGTGASASTSEDDGNEIGEAVVPSVRHPSGNEEPDYQRKNKRVPRRSYDDVPRSAHPAVYVHAAPSYSVPYEHRYVQAAGNAEARNVYPYARTAYAYPYAHRVAAYVVPSGYVPRVHPPSQKADLASNKSPSLGSEASSSSVSRVSFDGFGTHWEW